MVQLSQIVSSFGRAMVMIDARAPIGVNARSGAPYQPGIGPFTEHKTTEVVADELPALMRLEPIYLHLELPYPANPGKKCDLAFGPKHEPEWAIEVKMLRVLGDNGKVNNNMITHILSPYPRHRSALTDVDKLVGSGFTGQTAILVFGYDYDDWPAEEALSAFEELASRRACLGDRCATQFDDLVHPVHRKGFVCGWTVE